MPVNGSLGDQVGAAYETSKKSKVRRRRVVGTGGSPSSAGGCACWSASNDASIAQGNNLLPGRPVFLERCKIDPMYEAIRRGACCLSLAGSSEDDRPCFPGMVAGNCQHLVSWLVNIWAPRGRSSDDVLHFLFGAGGICDLFAKNQDPLLGSLKTCL